MLHLLDKLEQSHHLDRAEWIELLRADITDWRANLTARAQRIARATFGRSIFVRGLIEFTSYCRNDCYYCGLRASNRCAARYRLSPEEILACCREGHALGLRTFVLQGGEDPGWGGSWRTNCPDGSTGRTTPAASGGSTAPTNAPDGSTGRINSLSPAVGRGTELNAADLAIARLVSTIKEEFPDCAVTLSAGERPRAVYRAWKEAGADRYLLRHETADPEHYAMLHPSGMSLENRKRCLWDLKELGYQVGAGFMVGSPGQRPETLASDFLFLEELQPEMVGIGPFVPHHATPLSREHVGSTEQTLLCLSLLRLMLPQALLPATTALGTVDPAGREKGILAGANVVMPNLSPVQVREKYELYDDKICTGEEAAECRGCLAGRMELIGYQLSVGRGDHPSFRIGK